MVAMNVVSINSVHRAISVSRRVAYVVLPVREDDAYLRHFLGLHGGDIARFSPHYATDGPRGRGTYLVQHGDETAGS